MSANQRVDEELVDFENGLSEKISVFIETKVDLKYANGDPVNYQIEYLEDNTTIQINPYEMLTPGAFLDLTLSYKIQDLIEGGTFTLRRKYLIMTPR